MKEALEECRKAALSSARKEANQRDKATRVFAWHGAPSNMSRWLSDLEVVRRPSGHPKGTSEDIFAKGGNARLAALAWRKNPPSSPPGQVTSIRHEPLSPPFPPKHREVIVQVRQGLGHPFGAAVPPCPTGLVGLRPGARTAVPLPAHLPHACARGRGGHFGGGRLGNRGLAQARLDTPRLARAWGILVARKDTWVMLLLCQSVVFVGHRHGAPSHPRACVFCCFSFEVHPRGKGIPDRGHRMAPEFGLQALPRLCGV